MKKIIAASEIVHPKGLRARHGSLDKEHVKDLASAYMAKQDVEAIRVWVIKGHPGYNLARGAHRLQAMKDIGRTKIECEVKYGTWEEAVHDAVGDNQTHGLKRSNADKKQCMALMLELHPEWTARKIAEAVGVHHSTVDDFKKELSGEPADEEKAEPTNAQRLQKELLKIAKEDVPPESVDKWLEDLIAAAREFAAMIRPKHSPDLFDS